MKRLIHLLQSFEYDSAGDFLRSLVPSFKYQLVLSWVSMSGASTLIQRVFGLDVFAVIAFVVVILVELASGIRASQIRKEPFSSNRLSRFSLKMACYLIMIALPYVLSQSFATQGKTWVAEIFTWLHTFLVIQIAFEQVISILENLSTIEGKDKAFYIDKIRAFLTKKLSP